LTGAPPWFSNLASVFDPAPDLLDSLVAEYAHTAAKLSSQSGWWVAFLGWVVEKLVGDELSGSSRRNLREAGWVIYAAAYWCMLDEQKQFGIPAAITNLGMQPTPPSEDSVADMASKLTQRHAALDAGGEQLLRVLNDLLREEPCTGCIHGTAYNSGYIEVISEPPPLGDMPASLRAETGSIRVNARDFMRVDYSAPAPRWLNEWRSRYEASVRADPDAHERLISPRGGLKDLRIIWSEAIAWGHNNWDSQSTGNMSQEYFDDLRHWGGVVFNFGLEAISLASLTALVNGDVAAAIQAVRGNTLYLCAWGAFTMGSLDTTGQLPTIVSS